MVEVVRKWWDMESYGSSIVVDQRNKGDKIGVKILNSPVMFNGESYEVKLLWYGKQEHLSNKYSSALGQLKL